MRIYKHGSFNQWAKPERITDELLKKAIDEMERGLYEVNLGSGLYKKRVALPKRAKSGSHRTLVAFRMGKVTFFVYGFTKNVQHDIPIFPAF
jgi:hypothetical protein